MDKKEKKEIGSHFQSIWEELGEWEKDDVHINRLRVKFRNLEVRIFELL